MTTQISGTLGINKIKDGSVAQADLAPNVVGNGPCFSAFNAGNQSVSANTDTKVLFDTEEFDTNNNFSGSRFTATVAGVYCIQSKIRVAGDTVTNANLQVWKNGAFFMRINEIIGYQSDFGGTTLVSLVAGDYIEIYGIIAGTGALSFSSAGQSLGKYGSRVSGFLARAA